MEPLRCCTLTGADERTDLVALARMASDYPIAEWGVLYSQSRTQEKAGEGRYPRLGWIKDFSAMADELDVRTALHLCGKSAIDFLHEDEKVWELASKFGRVQLNVRAEGLTIAGIGADKLDRLFHSFHFSHGFGRIILQDTSSNRELCDHLAWRSKAVDFLIDGSGGQGISPDEWPSLRERRGRYGFAGGMGPDNVRVELERISAAHNGKSFWTDQESKLRTADDRFDLASCRVVLRETSEFLYEKGVEAGAKVVVNENYGDSENEDYRDTSQPRRVENLHGFWLNWYAGVSAGYAMVIPPKNASRPMYLDRRDGEFRGYTPTTAPIDFMDAVENSDAGCLKSDSRWYGVTTDGERVEGADRNDALLKAAIYEVVGPELPANCGELPQLVVNRVGETYVEECGPEILTDDQPTSTCQTP